MNLDAGHLESIGVAIIAALAAWASQRAASRASSENSRTLAETEAYNRARAFDLATIARQDEELEDCREEIKELKEQVEILQWRLSRSERGLPPAPYQKGT